uniref:Uncharacterized protein n=1 Tax=Chromera velia CCMP2878 TaxID=1169474 RepID=A0A0G4H9V5_9ALVE|eukprot:Cvel_25506.t1-p1 / transcript=Cvel_25506.t1 / gene=Cvel_25506 / organism=Chromera_velia_CCMP2878 / gene_product=hypothetical protein / transcript_product=hypothetical protein / location=Cvel_scaffold2901:12097-13921(+) / protein_length=542 / sequence_SO=supercontig / SO=protein_coding / is_pseudo=false
MFENNACALPPFMDAEEEGWGLDPQRSGRRRPSDYPEDFRDPSLSLTLQGGGREPQGIPGAAAVGRETRENACDGEGRRAIGGQGHAHGSEGEGLFLLSTREEDPAGRGAERILSGRSSEYFGDDAGGFDPTASIEGGGLMGSWRQQEGAAGGGTGEAGSGGTVQGVALPGTSAPFCASKPAEGEKGGEENGEQSVAGQRESTRASLSIGSPSRNTRTFLLHQASSSSSSSSSASVSAQTPGNLQAENKEGNEQTESDPSSSSTAALGEQRDLKRPLLAPEPSNGLNFSFGSPNSANAPSSQLQLPSQPAHHEADEELASDADAFAAGTPSQWAATADFGKISGERAVMAAAVLTRNRETGKESEREDGEGEEEGSRSSTVRAASERRETAEGGNLSRAFAEGGVQTDPPPPTEEALNSNLPIMLPSLSSAFQRTETFPTEPNRLQPTPPSGSTAARRPRTPPSAFFYGDQLHETRRAQTPSRLRDYREQQLQAQREGGSGQSQQRPATAHPAGKESERNNRRSEFFFGENEPFDEKDCEPV